MSWGISSNQFDLRSDTARASDEEGVNPLTEQYVRSAPAGFLSDSGEIVANSESHRWRKAMKIPRDKPQHHPLSKFACPLG